MIKPHHWSWTEDLSSGGQKSWHHSRLSNNLSRLLRASWIERRSSQLVLKQINSELKGLMMQAKTKEFGHLIQRANLLERP